MLNTLALQTSGNNSSTFGVECVSLQGLFNTCRSVQILSDHFSYWLLPLLRPKRLGHPDVALFLTFPIALIHLVAVLGHPDIRLLLTFPIALIHLVAMLVQPDIGVLLNLSNHTNSS